MERLSSLSVIVKASLVDTVITFSIIINTAGPYLICLLAVLSFRSPCQASNSPDPGTMSQLGTFKYFAFGSNLLAKRIHINNPTAKRYDAGVLDNYRLDFGYWSKRWGGYAATIVPDNSKHVWGAIWDIGVENLDDLDHQEGVHQNIYRPLEVTVRTPRGDPVNCRCYILVQLPEDQKVSGVPNLKPSKVYLNTIISGAKESNLPSEYIKMLEAIPDNGYNGTVYYGI